MAKCALKISFSFYVESHCLYQGYLNTFECHYFSFFLRLLHDFLQNLKHARPFIHFGGLFFSAGIIFAYSFHFFVYFSPLL